MLDLNRMQTVSSTEIVDLQRSLQNAKIELEEAVKTGNSKFNEMLALRMNIEDDLTQQLSQLKEELASQTRRNEER